MWLLVAVTDASAVSKMEFVRTSSFFKSKMTLTFDLQSRVYTFDRDRPRMSL